MENENQNEIVESQNTEIAPEQRYYNGPVTLEEAESYITSGLVSTARNYVAIGYWLRRIRDGKLYEEEGHQNFEQYVHEKYGKDKGWASKCIKVNQQLSKDGDSPLLDSRYRDYSTYQLVELAYMTEEQREQATPEQTVKQLQEIRKPKEIPYYDIDGQQEMEKDYPEVIPVVMSQLFPEEEIPKQEEQEPPVVEQTEVSQYFETKQEPVPGEPRKCITGKSKYGFCVCCGKDGIQCCAACVESCNCRCGWLEEQTEKTPAADEPENAAEKQRTGNCLYDPNHLCMLSEEAKRSPGIGEDCVNHCCCGCVKHGECKMECTVSENHPELQKVLENAAEKHQGEERTTPEEEQIDEKWTIGNLPQAKESMIRCLATLVVRERWPYLKHEFGRISLERAKSQLKYIQNEQLLDLGEGVEASAGEDIIEFFRDTEDLGVCSYERFTTQLQKCVDAEWEKQETSKSTKTSQQEKENVAELTDLQLLRDMLERKKRLLATNLAISGIDESDEHIRMQKLEAAALASAVCDLENLIEPEETVGEKPEQPELPYLRNNDQRAAFIDAYESWPLWIETKETGERYYRYDLPDGTSFVIKTYLAMLYDFESPRRGNYKAGYGENEQYILEPGKFFRDCRSNRSTMIEKLKELQKGEKES